MIFANGDFPEYYDISKPCQSQNTQNSYKNNYSIEIIEHEYQVAINIGDEPDWGYYVDLDNTSPPNKIYSKNKNPVPTLNLPQKNYTINKPIKYLPTIEEDMFHTNTNTNINLKNYTVEETRTASSIISGVTFCATVVFYYFYRNMRN
jgi:hypothetical protein